MVRRTISFDNGPKAALHQDLTAALGTEAFFCDSHSPRHRGTIEDTNGIFCRGMPRKIDFSDYSAQDIADLTGPSTQPRGNAYHRTLV